MKIIGFDQATKVTGYAIYDNGALVRHDAIRTNPNDDIYARMLDIYNAVRKLLREEKPDFVVIEATQFQNNYRVYSSLSQLQGIFFAALFEAGVEFEVVEPSAWRRANGIKGAKRAEQKIAAMNLVKELGITENTEDVCEAILIARYGVMQLERK